MSNESRATEPRCKHAKLPTRAGVDTNLIPRQSPVREVYPSESQSGMRAEVAASWHRSAAAGVPADGVAAPISLELADLRAARLNHPLSLVFPLLDDVLGESACASDAVMAVADEAGQLLWVCGSSGALRRAEHIGLVEGSIWDERLAGTNAPGLVLHQSRPAAVVGNEHFRESVHPWSCVAAPIHDPVTSRLIGLVDISGGEGVVNPQAMALVRATARLAEAELKNVCGCPPVVDDLRRPRLRLDVLGRADGLLTVDDGHGKHAYMRLSPRHSEIMILLAGASRGLLADELAVLLYEAGGGESTVRAEMNRLRRIIGDDLLGSRPYRITADIAGDWLAIEARLAAGDVAGAVRDFTGPLLFRSVAPGVVTLREALTNQVRTAVIASRRTDLMSTWTRSAWGMDDYEMWAQQRANLRRESPLWALAHSQLTRLDQELDT